MNRKKSFYFIVFTTCMLILSVFTGLAEKPSTPFIYRKLNSLQWYISADGKTTVQLWRGPELGDSKALHIGELHMKKDAFVPLHQHSSSTEILIMLEGEGILTIQGKSHVVKAPALIEIPQQTEHSFRVTSDASVRAIQLYVPAGPEHRFTRWKKRNTSKP